MLRSISIQGLLSGNKHDASVFYRFYAPKLLSFIAKKVASEKDCEEILQDTLFAFLEAIRDYNGQANLQTYLYAICRHKIVDFYRRKKIKHIVFSRVPGLEHLISPLLTPEEELDAVTTRIKIQKTLVVLLPQYREIIKLKYLDNLSLAEIAKRFAVTAKSIEMKLFRARKAFVEAFVSI